MKRRNITFFCMAGLESFITNFEGYLTLAGYEVNYVLTTPQTKTEAVSEAIAKADIVWIEWANELAINISQHHKEELAQKDRVIVRCHSYEALAGMPVSIQWEAITDLVFVAGHIAMFVKSMFEANKVMPNVKLHVVPNGVDMIRFALPADKPQNMNFCHLGYISNKKGPMLLMQAWAALAHRYPGSELHLAGEFQDNRYHYYVKYFLEKSGLTERTFFHGQVADVPKFLSDKSFVLCTSPWEAQNMSVCEAMASGLRPLVHNFPGAEGIYKDEILWSTIDEMLTLMEVYIEEDETPGARNKTYHRQFIKERYDHMQIMGKIEQDVLRGVLL